MANSYFDFKEFRLIQNNQVFKLSTDSVLLGAWAQPLNCPLQILDIGTGTGILSLIMAQRFPNAFIDTIDIDEEAIACASYNFKQSKWNKRLRTYHLSLHDFTLFQTLKYDLIITNPPYFQDQYIPLDEKKQKFKHTTYLTYESLFFYADRLCSESGILVLILPANVDVLPIAIENHFLLHRKLFVSIRPNKEPKRILWQFSKQNKPMDISFMTIYEHSEKNLYSEKYKLLTEKLYLHF